MKSNENLDFKKTNTRPYVSPRIELVVIELEQCLAAQSANVNPGINDSPVDHEWEDGLGLDKEFKW